MTRKPLIVLLSLTALGAGAEKERPKFSPGPIASFPSRQTNQNVTVAARVYLNDDEAREPFGKVNPYKYGILPVLVLIQNESGQALALDRIKVELMTVDREKVEATPAADIKYLSGPQQPKMTTMESYGMFWPMARIRASTLAALWAPSTRIRGFSRIISMRPGSRALARPSIAFWSSTTKPRSLSRAMMLRASPQLTA